VKGNLRLCSTRDGDAKYRCRILLKPSSIQNLTSMSSAPVSCGAVYIPK